MTLLERHATVGDKIAIGAKRQRDQETGSDCQTADTGFHCFLLDEGEGTLRDVSGAERQWDAVGRQRHARIGVSGETISLRASLDDNTQRASHGERAPAPAIYSEVTVGRELQPPASRVSGGLRRGSEDPARRIVAREGAGASARRRCRHWL